MPAKPYKIADGYAEVNENTAEKYGAEQQRRKCGLEKCFLIRTGGGETEVSGLKAIGINYIGQRYTGIHHAKITIVHHAGRIVEHIGNKGCKQLVKELSGYVA